MPRFYFDLREDDEIALDEEGMELPTIEAVQEEVGRSLANMARDRFLAGHKDGKAHYLAIEVRDGYGPVLQAKFTFSIDRVRN